MQWGGWGGGHVQKAHETREGGGGVCAAGGNIQTANRIYSCRLLLSLQREQQQKLMKPLELFVYPIAVVNVKYGGVELSMSRLSV